MNTTERQLLYAALRQDLYAFIQRSFQTVAPAHDFLANWHIEAMAWHLTQCASGEIKRLIITVPPRHLKSICASVAFPAWVLGHDPARRIICASYGAELAAKHARDCRMVMESAWYRQAFPRTRIKRTKRAELDFETTRQGLRFATSVGGALTGRGGSIAVIDDPIKPDDAFSEAKREAVRDWFDSTLYSRLDSKREGVIIIVMQRVHVDDLVGHVLAKDPTGWVHRGLPAIAEASERIPIGPTEFHERALGDVLHSERESQAVLDQIKAQMGSAIFSAQYLQNPLPVEGNMIKWDWFQTYSFQPIRQSGDVVTQSWDTASKAGEINDYSVCTTWLRRGKDHYLLDVTRKRLEYPALKRKIVSLADRYQPDAVLIEDAGSGIQLIQDLRAEGKVRPIAIPVIGDKETRMYTQCAQIEAGYVLLPEQAPWLEAFRAEILQFPKGRHDDQVDSMSQYLARNVPTNINYATQSVVVPSAFGQTWLEEFGHSPY